MVRVDNAGELAERFAVASNEAASAFGDGRLYVERFVENARHVEVQLLGDHHGSVVHLGDRDCSVQRRYQKVVEEAPAAALAPDLRDRLAAAALALGRELDYVGAGTVEFLVDLDRDDFSFLEVNTRVQVEHPVTEMVTGVDIVREQLRIAAGRPLSFTQSEVAVRGHAIECRINAESVMTGFVPTPGRIVRWSPPAASRGSSRYPRVHGLRRFAVLRLDARQAHRRRKRPQRRDRRSRDCTGGVRRSRVSTPRSRCIDASWTTRTSEPIASTRDGSRTCSFRNSARRRRPT